MYVVLATNSVGDMLVYGNASSKLFKSKKAALKAANKFYKAHPTVTYIPFEVQPMPGYVQHI